MRHVPSSVSTRTSSLPSPSMSDASAFVSAISATRCAAPSVPLPLPASTVRSWAVVALRTSSFPSLLKSPTATTCPNVLALIGVPNVPLPLPSDTWRDPSLSPEMGADIDTRSVMPSPLKSPGQTLRFSAVNRVMLTVGSGLDAALSGRSATPAIPTSAAIPRASNERRIMTCSCKETDGSTNEAVAVAGRCARFVPGLLQAVNENRGGEIAVYMNAAAESSPETRHGECAQCFAQGETAFVNTGKSWQNGADESLNGKFRDE